MKALVIGGTGPTGPHVVDGLQAGGYEVTILHRGTHESAMTRAEVEHIHANPFEEDGLRDGLAGRHFDVAVAAYGRLRLTAQALAGRSDHVVAIGGGPVYERYLAPERYWPTGPTVPIREQAPKARDRGKEGKGWAMARAESGFFSCVEQERYTGCLLRFPYVYGPGQIVPREWSVIRRILDKRPAILLPEGGLFLKSHGFNRNLAHAVVLAAGAPQAVNGHAFNVADRDTLTLRQWVEVIARAMGRDIEVVSMPDRRGHPGAPLALHLGAAHRVLDTAKAQRVLGYQDVLPAVEALTETVHWYLAHPLAPGGELETNLRDPFDYEFEDACLRLMEQLNRRLDALSGASAVDPPGQARGPNRYE